MRRSQLFTKTFRELPKDEESINAQLLIRAGYVQKLMAGVYTFLPLGLLTLRNIENVVRDEMNRIGGQEVLMPALHPIEHYEKTGRAAIEDLFHTQLSTGSRFVLGQSHEEVVVPMVQKFIQSYRDLPLAVYQIQTKFRNELRAKSGLFRGREFIMKDLYSFHASEEDFEAYYKTVRHAYRTIFARVGIGEKTFLTYAGGGTFSKISHEFQTIAEAGEDTIAICKHCRIAINEQDRALFSRCPECDKEPTETAKSIEVANIFPLKTRYADAFGLTVKSNTGEDQKVIMGCYGIGISRLMGTIAETHHDEKGLAWPEAVAPFQFYLIGLGEQGSKEAETLYTHLQKTGISVLYDDREDTTAGEKFADADLMGVPQRVVVSDKTLKDKSYEMKNRATGDVSLTAATHFIKQYAP